MKTNKIKSLLKEKRISQRQAAELLGVSVTAFNLALKRGDFRVSWLEKLSKILNVSISEFFHTSTNTEIQKLHKEISSLRNELDLQR